MTEIVRFDRSAAFESFRCME